MKIAIDKSTLVQALDTVTKAVPTAGKVIQPMLECILFEAKDGTLKLVKNNLESTIEYPIECEVISPGSAIVNAKMVCDIARKMPDEELDIIVEDKKMNLEAGKAVMKMAVIDSDYPGIPDITSKISFEVAKKLFVDAINGVAFAVYEGEEKPTLTGIKINIEDGKAEFVAIDGYMVAWQSFKIDAPEADTLLCGKSLENVSKSITGEGMVNIDLSDNFALITTDNIKVSVRVVEGTYMNYKRYAPSKFKTEVRINTKELTQSLERAMLVFESGAKGVISEPLKITSKADSIRLEMKSEKGSFDEEIFCNVFGEDVKIGLDPRKLITCLKHVTDKEIILGFSGEIAPAFIMPVEGENYRYMILPVRTK
ncbi:DNA polymerase III subunit beta [Ruminiclostridium josui]|uniref:DNA polymerase III subunit beta n=1 Tax=Ruminiclostridium josui TaxID=1499 RepID=UPI000467C05F|nr:DNA polymerase III subunit beta [Ruminiclostridium josui]